MLSIGKGAIRRVTIVRQLSTSTCGVIDVKNTALAQPVQYALPQPPTSGEVEQLATFISNSKHLIAITGAGISTSSGIPDYRGPNGSYKRGHTPMSHADFMTNEHSRKRFWARSMVGWQAVSKAVPNDAHIALAQLESAGKLKYLITQNVDRLHHRAGSQHIMDIHGRVDTVRCQGCFEPITRQAWQVSLTSMNESFIEKLKTDSLPTRTTLPLSYKQLQRQRGIFTPSIPGINKSTIRADGDADLAITDYSEVRVVYVDVYEWH